MSTHSADMEERQQTPPVKSEPNDSAYPTPRSTAAARRRPHPVDNAALQNLIARGRENNLRRSTSNQPRHNEDRASTSRTQRSTENAPAGPPDRARHRNGRSSASREDRRGISPTERLRTELDQVRGGTDVLESFDPHGKDPIVRFHQLDDGQKYVVNRATKDRKPVCCIALSGAGKSVICMVMCYEFANIGAHVALVTPSGTSAVNVQAQTLHSFFGLGASTNKGINELIRRMTPAVRERIASIDVLIIDEISMVSCETFDRMDRLAKAAREEPDMPFGGLQLIIFGDFYQLPPVTPWEHCFECGKKRELGPAKRKRGGRARKVWRCPDHGGEIEREDCMWAFRSAEWDKVGFEYTPLTRVHRQQEKKFLDVLAKARYGKRLTPEDVALLKNHECDVENAVELVPLRETALRINREQLEKLTNVAHVYECHDNFIWQRELHPELDHIQQNVRRGLQRHSYEETVRLKQGQPVILQKNLDVRKGLVNGSQGVIDHFVDYAKVHQQSESSFADKNISLLRTDSAKDFMRNQGRSGRSTQLPVVKFNNHPELVTVLPDCRIEELGFKKPHSLLMRTQIPLLAGWALTIHKSQGMTLEKGIILLDSLFKRGMGYVAMSRVKTLKGLKVLGLAEDTFEQDVDEEVKTFLQQNFQVVFD
jgi:ATP-dependent DNA helicase PIF1